MLSDKDKKQLLNIARDSISSEFTGDAIKINENIKSKFSKNQGCFVTLHSVEFKEKNKRSDKEEKRLKKEKKKNMELRGCIGYPEPVMPLHEAIVQAAKAAAFNDPRFSPLNESELDNINIEISVLTVPEKIDIKNAKDYLNKIKIGKDGLIIRNNFRSGLLLPQVPVEWEWDVKDFLENLCHKAGMPSDAWKDLSNKIYSFQAEIFSE